MKRKHLALLLAAAMIVTSVDATALVSAADFSAEVTDEAAVQEEEAVPADEEAADVDIADEETADVSDETAADVESEDAVTEDIQAEDNAEEADFTSEIKEDVAVEVGDGENNTTIPTSGVTALELDKTYAVDITADKKEQWFSFKPQKTGKYGLYSHGADDESIDPIVDIYDNNGNKIKTEDDCDDNHDFKLVYTLSAGNTYYFCTRLYNSDSKASYSVTIQEMDLESITLTKGSMLTEYVQGLDQLEFGLCEGNIKYNNDEMKISVESVWDDEEGYARYHFDGLGGDDEEYILRAVKKNNDGTTTIVRGGTFSEMGTYKIQVIDSDENIIVDSAFTINVISKDVITDTLKVGENENVISPLKEYEHKWYKFTPDVTGRYYFDCISYYSVYDGNQSVKGTGYDCYLLEGGKTYYIRLCGGFGSENKGTLGITQYTKLMNMTFAPNKTEVIWGDGWFSDVFFGELTGTDAEGKTFLTMMPVFNRFSDGETGYDSEGNQLTFHLKDLNGKGVKVDDEWIKPGTYTYWFEAEDNVKTTPTTVVIKAPQYPNVRMGSAQIEISRDGSRFSFVPEETGFYSLTAENADKNSKLDVGLYDELYYMEESGKKTVEYMSDDGISDLLIKGRTYYIRAYCDSDDDDDNVTVPEKVAAKLTIARKKLNTCKYTTTTTPATCATEGKIVETCQTHQGETITTVIPKKEHTPGAWTTAKEATVFAEGTSVQKCSVCGAVVKSQAITKLAPTLKLNLTAGKTVPMKVKQSFNVKVTGLANGDGVKSWKSNKTKIATVRNGKITAKKTGTAKITVTLNSGYTTWFKVKVQKSKVNTTSLKVLNKATGKNVAKKVTLKRRGKLNLSAVVAPVTSKQKVTFSSSKKSVATVNSKGVVTAKKKGKATITVKSGKKTVKIKITVK